MWFVRGLDLGALEGLRVGWGALVFATAFALGFRYCGAVIWLEVLKSLGAGRVASKTEMCFVYAKAWLGRYVPGKVTWILGKVYFASALGVPKRALAMSSVYEAALHTATILALSMLLLVADPRLDLFTPAYKVLLATASAALLVGMLPSLFNRVVGFIHAKTVGERISAEGQITYATMGRVIGLNGIGFLLSGLGYFFLTRSIYPDLGFEQLFFIIGTFNLAGAVGVLAIFAPSGLGVREGVQLVLLPLVMPPEVALVVTIAARLWSITVDMLFLGVTGLHRTLMPQAAFHPELPPRPQ